jgi:membrane protease YdiL (CAAX protease family)
MSEKSQDSKAGEPKRHGALSARNIFAFIWPALGLFIGGTIAVFFLRTTGIVDEASAKFFQEEPWARVPIDVFVNVLALAIIVLPFYKYFFGPDAHWKLIFALERKPGWKDFGIAFIAFGAYFATSALLIALLSSFMPGFDLDESQELGVLQPDTWIEFASLLIILVVIPPLVEELIFRGYMFIALRKRLSFWPTAILTSIAFGIVHGQWNVGADTFVLSLFLCGLREYTKSLWAPIFLHGIKNGIAYLILFVFQVQP